MALIRAIARDSDDVLVDTDQGTVLDRYAAFLGCDVEAPVWASDIPDEVWAAAESDNDDEEEDGIADENQPG